MEKGFSFIPLPPTKESRREQAKIFSLYHSNGISRCMVKCSLQKKKKKTLWVGRWDENIKLFLETLKSHLLSSLLVDKNPSMDMTNPQCVMLALDSKSKRASRNEFSKNLLSPFPEHDGVVRGFLHWIFNQVV